MACGSRNAAAASVPENRGGRAGERTRRGAGQAPRWEINVQQYACAGLNFGSYYDRSPIIAYDGAAHPAATMNSYTASTVGLPHAAYLVRRRHSLYDDGSEFRCCVSIPRSKLPRSKRPASKAFRSIS